MDNGAGKELNSLQGVPNPNFAPQEVTHPVEVNHQAIGHQAIFSPEETESTQEVKEALDQIPPMEAPAPPLAPATTPEKEPEEKTHEPSFIQLFDRNDIRPMKEGIDDKTIEASKKIEDEISANPAAALEAFQDLRAIINNKPGKKAA